MILGMLRVRDEARWIERVIRSIVPICQKILVFDDHSSDGTPEICAAIEKVEVIPSPFTGLNESRDKNVLIERAEELKPDWIIHIDGDEELAPGGLQIIKDLTSKAGATAYRFQILYLWDSENQIRVDGIYNSFRRTRLFRFQSGMRFGTTGNGGNFHCGNDPSGRRPWECDAKILHYGYMHREDRLRKYQFYNAADGNNPGEDGYRHMVIGDLFPADSQFKHGGPLRLQPIV